MMNTAKKQNTRAKKRDESKKLEPTKKNKQLTSKSPQLKKEPKIIFRHITCEQGQFVEISIADKGKYVISANQAKLPGIRLGSFAKLIDAEKSTAIEIFDM